jgi:hypothetical protein
MIMFTMQCGCRELYNRQAALRIHDILVWTRIRGSMPLTYRSAIFIIDIQDANKKQFFFTFLTF